MNRPNGGVRIAAVVVVTLLSQPAVSPAPAPAATSSCPCSVWPATAVPATPDAGDPTAVEVGVRFTSDIDGYVTGVRYYKSLANTGTHVGSVWTASGVVLGSATFNNETGSGWQEVDFTQPIAVAAGGAYVASYHTDTGHYAADVGYFRNAGVDNPPLHALQDGVGTSDGVYRVGPSGFPSSTFRSANYWVDVVFSPTAVDVQPPTVIAVSPLAGATGVATNNVTATFNEPVQASTVAFSVTAGATSVAGAVTYDGPTRTATFSPNGPLLPSTNYGVSVTATDLAGNPMTAPATWSFVTRTPPPPNGPGGPILVVVSAGNAFTRYYAEILRNEGLQEFSVADISTVTATTLAGYDLVVLGDMKLLSSQVNMFRSWVSGGGQLIAMHPDKGLASLLGIASTNGTVANGYLAVNQTGAGTGITSQTMQFHGSADLYSLNSGTTQVAQLYSTATTPTSNPAVTLRSVGSNGGHASAFTYDLAQSVVYTRQGNPAWAGQARSGDGPTRAIDLFWGAASFDPQPDWLDLTKVSIPQADEQQRLLVNLIETMQASRRPLPKFWYLPNGAKAVVVLTGDDHANGGTTGRFDIETSLSPPGCSVPDWQCVRSSSYIYPGTPITDAQAAADTAAGFEVGAHVTTGCQDFTPSSLAANFTSQMSALQALLPSDPAPSSARTHCVPWSDWSSEPNVELANGVRLDATYYWWPPAWAANNPGFMTGSGMPMRYANSDGTMIDVFQATTQMTDESGQAYPQTVNTLLDNAQGPLGYYGVFTLNAHTDQASSAVERSVIASAQARQVPLVSGRQLLTWLDARDNSSFGGIRWSTSGALTFSVNADAGARGLQGMVPFLSSASPFKPSKPGSVQTITRGGSPVPFTVQTVKGVSYAVLAATSGSYQVSYSVNSAAPTISALAAAPAPGAATISWTTDQYSTSKVVYGTSPTGLTTTVSDANLVTAHSVALNGLLAGRTYYFRVTSVNAQGLSRTSPSTSVAPATFTVPNQAVQDSTAADFGAGTGAGTYVSQVQDGEVTLAPSLGTEFSGTTLPAGWSPTIYGSGGSVTVAGGQLNLNAAAAATTATFAPGQSVEFSAQFSGSANQHVGFAANLNQGPWAIFSTPTAGGTLYARTSDGTNSLNTALPGVALGVFHRYRIDWMTSSVVFSVDGAVVATQTVSLNQPMSFLASSLPPNLNVDWVHVTPYASSGVFTSRVLDAGAVVQWAGATWNSAMPAGTALAISVRTGPTAVPDGSWTAWQPLAGSGASIGGSSEFIQYQATLTTSDQAQTPVLNDITLAYGQ